MARRDTSGEMNEQEALLGALRHVLEPLAELAVQRGLPYAPVEELARRAFVAPPMRHIPICCRTARSAASAPPPASTAARWRACWR